MDEFVCAKNIYIAEGCLGTSDEGAGLKGVEEGTAVVSGFHVALDWLEAVPISRPDSHLTARREYKGHPPRDFDPAKTSPAALFRGESKMLMVRVGHR